MSALGSTAEVCAALRTLAGVDPVAPRFLRGPKVTTLARVRLLQPLLRPLACRLVDGAYAYETVRTTHLDQLVAAELERGAEQLLLLGAGFDTRAHRFALRTFEVDRPEVSRRKRRLAAGLPGQVTYVEADFERDDVRVLLEDAGFDPGARSLVLWIGVSMYLTAAAAERTLRLAAELAPGGVVVFDYVFRTPEPDFLRAIERRGEPLGFVADDLDGLLASCGLEPRLDLRGLPYPFIGIAHARVPESGPTPSEIAGPPRGAAAPVDLPSKAQSQTPHRRTPS